MFYLNKIFHLLLYLFFILSPVYLSNCGFQPLYADKNNSSISILESEIYIEDIPGRTGQIFKNSLLEHFGSTANKNNELSLKVTLSKYIVPLAFRSDKTVTRFNVIINSEYILKQNSNNLILTSGTSRSIASYSVVFSEFANLSASKDAEERATLDLAKKIARLIGVSLLNYEKNNK